MNVFPTLHGIKHPFSVMPIFFYLCPNSLPQKANVKGRKGIRYSESVEACCYMAIIIIHKRKILAYFRSSSSFKFQGPTDKPIGWKCGWKTVMKFYQIQFLSSIAHEGHGLNHFYW